MTDIAVVVGNPKPASRTLDAAVKVATRLAGREPSDVVDVIDLGAGLLGWGDEQVVATVERIRAAPAAVYASPTYKASFTGVLKLFLDQIPTDGLRGQIAYPLMLGGAWQHGLAPDVFLKPVLVELGAACPVRGLYLLDSDYDDPPHLAPWLEAARRFAPAER